MSGQGAGSESSVASGEQRSLIGTSPPRYDGVDKVTGRAEYGADVCLVGSLHGKVLRSPHAHARIRSIDTRCAEALPGVEAVVTAEDLPQADGPAETNYRYLSGNTLARDKVLYVGHAIAAVAATSPHIAERATHPIRVDYEVLPPVLDVREAMQQEAPLLHEDMRTRSLAGLSEKPSNIASRFRHVKGDPEKGFAEADVIVEQEFRTATVHQGYIEPPAATAH